MAEECSSIIVVVSPLISLMKDQVVKFSERVFWGAKVAPILFSVLCNCMASCS